MSAARCGVSLPCSWKKSGFTRVGDARRARHRPRPPPAPPASAGPASAPPAARPAPASDCAGLLAKNTSPPKSAPARSSRIGGGGRIDPADFDLDRHGMGLMARSKPREIKQSRNQRLKPWKNLGFGQYPGPPRRVWSGRDGPADHQDVGARHPALLPAPSPAAGRPARAFGPDARHHQQEIRPQRGAQRRDLMRRADHAHPGRNRVLRRGQPQHLFAGAGPRWPTASRSASDRLVSTVTAITLVLGIDAARGFAPPLSASPRRPRHGH